MDEPLEGIALLIFLVFGVVPSLWVCYDFYVRECGLFRRPTKEELEERERMAQSAWGPDTDTDTDTKD